MLKLVGNSTMWTDKSKICPLHYSIVKRCAIYRFGHVLHSMRKRWKRSVSLMGRLGRVFTIIKMISFPSPLHLLFAFRHRSPKPNPLSELGCRRRCYSCTTTAHTPSSSCFLRGEHHLVYGQEEKVCPASRRPS
jgi:hypothetical protein